MKKGSKCSDEQRKKISASLKGNVPWNKGKHHSEETKMKMSLSRIGKKYNIHRNHTLETRKKISASLKGNIPWNKGKTLSDEYKMKLSLAHKGKPSTFKGKKHRIDSIEKMILSHSGKKNVRFGKHLSEEHKKKFCYNGLRIHRSKIEIKIEEYLKQNFPEYIWTHGGRRYIGIDRNGEKQYFIGDCYFVFYYFIDLFGF